MTTATDTLATYDCSECGAHPACERDEACPTRDTGISTPDRPCTDCHGAPEVHGSCDCTWAREVNAEVESELATCEGCSAHPDGCPGLICPLPPAPTCHMFNHTGSHPEDTQWPCDVIDCSDCRYSAPAARAIERERELLAHTSDLYSPFNPDGTRR